MTVLSHTRSLPSGLPDQGKPPRSTARSLLQTRGGSSTGPSSKGSPLRKLPVPLGYRLRQSRTGRSRSSRASTDERAQPSPDRSDTAPPGRPCRGRGQLATNSDTTCALHRYEGPAKHYSGLEQTRENRTLERQQAEGFSNEAAKNRWDAHANNLRDGAVSSATPPRATSSPRPCQRRSASRYFSVRKKKA